MWRRVHTTRHKQSNEDELLLPGKLAAGGLVSADKKVGRVVKYASGYGRGAEITPRGNAACYSPPNAADVNVTSRLSA